MENNLHRLTENVKLLQKVLLLHNGKFLILRRSSASVTRANQWDLPGGNSEWPQRNQDLRSPHQADVVREVAEETGITIDPVQITENVYVGTFFEAEKQIYTIILGWKLDLSADFDESSLALSEEHTEFAWITQNEFETYNFGFAGDQDGFIRQMVNNAVA